MAYRITEVQDKDTTRIYNLEGVKLESVQSFWETLKASRVIENFDIEEVK